MCPFYALCSVMSRFHTGDLSSIRSQVVLTWFMDLHYRSDEGLNSTGQNSVWDGGGHVIATTRQYGRDPGGFSESQHLVRGNR